jgi:hypothetical protein
MATTVLGQAEQALSMIRLVRSSGCERNSRSPRLNRHKRPALNRHKRPALN